MKIPKFLAILLISAITMIVPWCSGITFAEVDIDAGLIAFYPFNGDANDETGNGFNGTVYNAILTEDRHENPNSAYQFNGNNSYIDIGNSLDFPCGDYSVSVWFLNNGLGPHVNGYGQKIMSKATMFNDFYFAVFTNGHSDPYAGALFWQQYQGSGSGPKTIIDLDYNYLDNNWHHLAVNKVGNYGEMWVDGILIGTASTFTDVCNSQNLYIGYTDHPDWYQRNEGHWNGIIDDIRIYDRVLSEAEIQILFLLGLSPLEKISYISDYLEDSIENGSIVGEGGAFWDAETAIRRMVALLDYATWCIENEIHHLACFLLRRALRRCDGEGGNIWNMDYINGDSRDELAAMITELLHDLGCHHL